MPKQIGLIGVPSSAGAHWPGQEKAPQVLRAAGLVKQLRSAGCSVIDHGDLPRVRYQNDKEHKHSQNLPAVVNVARSVAEQVEMILRSGEIPLVIGGDCTLTIGMISGFLRADENPTLLYFDGGPDLNTPITSPTGILDSMGLAHMLGEQGTAGELRDIGPRIPLLSNDAVTLFGCGPQTRDTPGPERQVLEQRPLHLYPAENVSGEAEQIATEALTQLEKKAQKFVIHFDVDVMDFVDFPVADVPQFNTGLTFQEAITCLSVFTASPWFGGIVITEFNPDHADEGGTLATTFVQGVAQVLTQHK